MTGSDRLLPLLLPLLSASVVVSRPHNTSSDSFLHPQFVYHSEDWLITFLRNLTETFPHLTDIYSVGESVEGPQAVSLCELCQKESSAFRMFIVHAVDTVLN